MSRDHEHDCLLSAERLQQLVRERYERPLPRRFYDEVSVQRQAPGRYCVLLDNRAVRTPLKHLLQLPTRPLAEAVAAEWRAQHQRIDPATMPLTGLANAAIDKADPRRPGSERTALEEHLHELAAHDMLCYRADDATQQELAQRQRQLWDPLLQRAEAELGARLHVAQGIMPVSQPSRAIAALMAPLRQAAPFPFAAMFSLATLAHSVVLALAVARRWLPPARAWQAATVEEQWNIELWGADAEAAARLQARRQAFLAAARFLQLLADEQGEE